MTNIGKKNRVTILGYGEEKLDKAEFDNFKGTIDEKIAEATDNNEVLGAINNKVADLETLKIDKTTFNTFSSTVDKKVETVTAQLAENAKQQQVTPIMEVYDSRIDIYRQVLIHDENDNLYAMYSRTGSTYTFEKSTDKGNTWRTLSNLPAIMKCIYKIHFTGTLIAIESVLTTSLVTARMWRSTDDGVTWSIIDQILNFPPLSSQGICETPSGSICIGEYGNIGNHSYRILRSTDDGNTWSVVLSSPGTDPSGDPGHIHSITFDPYARKLIAFMDRPAITEYGARIYQSDDNGATWSIIGVVDSNTKPNFVSPMYFDKYIAWGSDNERNGVISRIRREDFYAGNFDESEDVLKLNDKAYYFTFPIREGAWLLNTAAEIVGTNGVNAVNKSIDGGTYANEILIVSDNGKVISGGITTFKNDSILGVMSGVKGYFPSYKYDRFNHNGFSWTNVVNGRPRTYSSVPYSVGTGLPSNKLSSWITEGARLPNMLALRGAGSDNSDIGMIYVDQNDSVIISNSKSPANIRPEIKFTPTGDIEFKYGGTVLGRIKNSLFEIGKVSLASNGVGITAGSGDPNGIITAQPGSLYLNWQGGIGQCIWTKINGTGNTGWMPINAVGGNSAYRPTSKYLGMCYFDSTIGKPIWWNGTTWVDSAGTTA